MKGIREVTNLTGVTESALRYYNEKGILKPTLRKETGRKQWLYSDEDISRLRLIMLYRRLGISAADISLMLSDEGKKKLILEGRLSQLTEQKKELDSQECIIRVLKVMDKLSEK